MATLYRSSLLHNVRFLSLFILWLRLLSLLFYVSLLPICSPRYLTQSFVSRFFGCIDWLDMPDSKRNVCWFVCVDFNFPLGHVYCVCNNNKSTCCKRKIISASIQTQCLAGHRLLLVEHTVEVCAEKYATPCILQTHRGMQNTRRVLPFTKLSSEKPYYPPRFRVLSSIPFFGNSPFRLTRVRPLDGQRCRTEFQPFPLQILITLDGISRIASYISRVSRKLLPGRGTRNFDGQLTAILRA